MMSKLLQAEMMHKIPFFSSSSFSFSPAVMGLTCVCVLFGGGKASSQLLTVADTQGERGESLLFKELQCSMP